MATPVEDNRGAGGGTLLLAFLVGAVAGAAVALLYAPASGRETRERLGEKAREGARRASDAAQAGRDVIDALKDVYKQATTSTTGGLS
jgi:gas vesicle protein